MDRQHVTWADVERLVARLMRALPEGYDCILAVARGGLVPACLIGERAGIRHIVCAAVMLYEGEERRHPEPVFIQFPDEAHMRGRHVLVVDDVWDSGSTIVAVRERLRRAGARADVCVLHYKPARSRFPGDKPDFYAEETDAWIVYPWDPALPLPE